MSLLLDVTGIQPWLSSIIVLYILSIEKEGGESGRGIKEEGEMEDMRGGVEGTERGVWMTEEWEGGKHISLALAQVSNFNFTESHCWSQGVERL